MSKNKVRIKKIGNANSTRSYFYIVECKYLFFWCALGCYSNQRRAQDLAQRIEMGLSRGQIYEIVKVW